MNILIIYAHPNPDSFNSSILRSIKEGLDKTENQVEVLDLYKENFDPVLRFDAQNRRRDLYKDPYTEKYRNLISNTDHIIFIYPVWWYGMPAILKGFIDRVFVTDFAYKYEGGLPKGLLKGKSAWVVYTIDSPDFYVRLFRHNMEWRNIKDAILKFCGFGKVERLMFTGVKTSSSDKREKWLRYLYKRSLSLENLK